MTFSKDIPGETPNPPHSATIYSIKFKYLGITAFGFPLLAVIIATVVSYANNWNDYVSFTECPGVQTRFKSMSHIAGYYAPQNYVWILLIVLHYPQRLFIGSTLRNLYLGSSNVTNSRLRLFLTRAIQFLNPIEALSLVLMSVMHVETIFAFHAFGFALWGTSFAIYILFETYLHHVSGWRSTSTKCRVTFWIKLWICISVWIGSGSMILFYVRWWRFCSLLNYALFCCTEYFIIILNLLYHLMVFIELPNVALVISADYSGLYSNERNSETCSTASTNASTAKQNTSLSLPPSPALSVSPSPSRAPIDQNSQFGHSVIDNYEHKICIKL